MLGTKGVIKVGIVGCGAIGAYIAENIKKKDFRKRFLLIGLCDKDNIKAEKLKRKLKSSVKILPLDELIKKADFIIEAASSKISFEVAKKSAERSKDSLIMSAGGLIEKLKYLKALCYKNNCALYIPSGAISGLDGLKAAKMGKIYSVTLTTKKPPKGLKGAPYIISKKINLDKIKKETLIFKGSAKDAVRYFPQNINVAAILSMCGIGSDKTSVRIKTAPFYTKNIHEVEIVGDFGKIKTESINLPSRDNPKTSALAMLSAIAKLKEITDSLSIGT